MRLFFDISLLPAPEMCLNVFLLLLSTLIPTIFFCAELATFLSVLSSLSSAARGHIAIPFVASCLVCAKGQTAGRNSSNDLSLTLLITSERRERCTQNGDTLHLPATIGYRFDTTKKSRDLHPSSLRFARTLRCSQFQTSKIILCASLCSFEEIRP